MTYSTEPQICRQCGGKCCQGHPGLWINPKRFFAIFFPDKIPQKDKITDTLTHYQIDLRDVDGVTIPTPQNNTSGCIFLSLTGCKLTEQRRPCQCLALEPNIDTLLNDDICCSMPPDYGTNTARNNWREFWLSVSRVDKKNI